MNKRSIYLSSFWVLTAVLSVLYIRRCTVNQAAVMPGPGWQVMKAEWGSGNRWIDVTYQRPRVVIRQWHGAGKQQPTSVAILHVGAVKVLRIQARNSRGQSRQFSL